MLSVMLVTSHWLQQTRIHRLERKSSLNVVPSACSPTQNGHFNPLPISTMDYPTTTENAYPLPQGLATIPISTSCMQGAHISPLGQIHPSWVAQLHSLQTWNADRPGRMITLSTVFVLSVFLDPILPIPTEKKSPSVILDPEVGSFITNISSKV